MNLPEYINVMERAVDQFAQAVEEAAMILRKSMETARSEFFERQDAPMVEAKHR
jgi:hypothetical protein